MANFGPLMAEIGSGVWGTPANFNEFRVFAFVTAATSLITDLNQTARCLAASCAGTLCIHFRGILSPKGILTGAKFNLRPSPALSYIDSVSARHSSSGRQTNFAELSRGRHLYSAGWPSRWALADILVIYIYERCCYFRNSVSC